MSSSKDKITELVQRLQKNLPKTLSIKAIKSISKDLALILMRELSSAEIDLIIGNDYPRLDDIDFLIKITKLVNAQLKADDIIAEFSESTEINSEQIRARIERDELFYFQRFVTKYINRNSPYRGIELFYGLGAGKTRTSIAICNSFIENGRKVLVLSPASLEENFRKEYLGYTPPSLRMLERADINDYFKFLHYNAPNFAKSKEDEPDQLFDREDLDNKVIIIDEVHNFISLIVNAMRAKRPRGIRIYNKIMNAKNIKIITLSGTPIINFPFEAAILVNILVGYLNSKNEPWKESDGSDKYPIFTENEEDFNRIYLDSNPHSREYKIKETTEKEFCRRLMGNISYYGGLTGGGIYPDLTEHIVKMNMSDHQFEIYLQQRAIELSEISEKLKKSFYSDKSKEINMDVVEKKSSFRSATRELCNFAFPSEIPRPWRKEISIRYSSFSAGKGKEKQKYIERLDIGNLLAEPEEKEKDDDLEEEELEGADRRLLERELASGTLSSTKRKVIIDKIYHSELERTLAELEETKDIYLTSDINGHSLLEYCSYEHIIPSKSDIEKKPYDLFKYEMEPTTKEIPSLKYFSPKMLSILYNIEKARDDNLKIQKIANSANIDPLKVHQRDGNVVIYSYFNRVEGINIMQKVLEVAGYKQYKYTPGIAGKRIAKAPGKYCFWEGKDRDKILEIFNSPSNKYGGIIKILLITEAGAEGITLKNVRQMHIMEPYWNEVQTRQVIGRAKRMYSHKDLGKPTLIPASSSADSTEIIPVYLTKEKQRKIQRNSDGSPILDEKGEPIFETKPDGSPLFEKDDKGQDIYLRNTDGKFIYSVDKSKLDAKYDTDISMEYLVYDKDNVKKLDCVIDKYRMGEQHVDVFRYKMKFSEDQLKKVDKEFRGETDEFLTTDEVLSLIAERKKAVTDQIELFMKQTSADCLRNKEDNDKHEIYNGNPPINCYVIRGLTESASRPAFSVAEVDLAKTSREDLQKTIRVETGVYPVIIINLGKEEKQKYMFKRDVRKSEKTGGELPCIYIYPEEVKSLGTSSVKPIGMLIKVGQKEDSEIYKGRKVSSSKETEVSAGHIKYSMKLEGTTFVLESIEL